MKNINYYKKLPRKRTAVGALFFNRNSDLLIVKTGYKNHWSIPGGIIDKDESPRKACLREIKEEIGINIKKLEFLCVDYTRSTKEKDDSLQFIFLGGILKSQQIHSIKIDHKEIIDYKFFNPRSALHLLSGPTQKRLSQCLKTLQNHTSTYLENGV